MRIKMTETCNTLDGPYRKGVEYDVSAERGEEFTRIGWADEVQASGGDKSPPADPPADPPAPVVTKPKNKGGRPPVRRAAKAEPAAPVTQEQ